MTKLDLTHHLHMGIIPWALGHWFIWIFIVTILYWGVFLIRLTVILDLFLLRNRTCRTFYSVKLGRVLYVAILSTCIMKFYFRFFSVSISQRYWSGLIWFLMSRYQKCTVFHSMFQYVLLNMYKHVSELNRNGMVQALNVIN